MSFIKSVIKRSRVYQYHKCSKEYEKQYLKMITYTSQKVSDSNNKRLKVIYEGGNTYEGKIKQISNLLKKIDINLTMYDEFIYFIDENVVPYSSNLMVDNMPYNYKYIVDSSLLEVKRNDVHNNVANENKKTAAAIEAFIDRIAEEAKKFGQENHKINLAVESIIRIKNEPAINLRDALQRILFFNQLLNQTGHKLNGFGRLDKILDRFSVDEYSSQLIYSFLKTLHKYYNFKSSAMLGDTGQIIILGGLETDGTYFKNNYTYIVMRELNKLMVPDPKVLLRVAKNMPDDILEIAIEGIKSGTGSPLISNDEIVIPALVDFGYEQVDAHNYGVSACWEPLSIGNSFEQNNLGDIEYGRVMADILSSEEFENCTSFADVFNLYKARLSEHINTFCSFMDSLNWSIDPITTLAMPCCLQSGKDVALGGAKYNNFGLLSVGLATAVNSLINIKILCFEEAKYSLHTLREAILSNFYGFKDIKACLSECKSGFGIDSNTSIKLTNSIIDYTNELFELYTNKFNGTVKFGLSSPAYVNKGKGVGCTADGRCADQPFSTHISLSTSGSITDIVLFSGKLNYNGKRSNGNVVDVMLQPSFFNHNKFKKYIKAGIEVGIFQIQFNVISYETLLDAKVHPEKYPDLVVRVWGFSAYFKDVPEDYQDTLIARAKKMDANL